MTFRQRHQMARMSAEGVGSFDAACCALVPVTYWQAKVVVSEAHYIGRLGSTSVSLGLRMAGQLAGVITFGTIPANNAASICGAPHAAGVLELTRLALYDWAPRNSESWFIAHALQWLTIHRPDVSILISYAEAAAGHVGTIYQATNWIYTGQSDGDVFWRCSDGRRLHPRTSGWDITRLPQGRWEPSPGKHRYVTFLGSARQRRRLRASLLWPALPYPKASAEHAEALADRLRATPPAVAASQDQLDLFSI